MANANAISSLIYQEKQRAYKIIEEGLKHPDIAISASVGLNVDNDCVIR